jgi:hypothetical protein
MSSNLAYIAYEAMTSGVSSISMYILDSNNNHHNVSVVVPEPNVYVYFDNSNSSYTAVAFYLVLNGTTIVSVPFNNFQKTAQDVLVVVLNLQISVNLPCQLGQLVTQAIQGIFAGLEMNLGCSATAYYTVSSSSGSSSGSTGMSFSLVNNSQFNASASISYSQGQTVTVTQIVIKCSYGNVQQTIFSGSLQSSQCTSSSGCTFTVTVTFSS